MLHGTLALATRIDRAEIDFCAAAARAGLPGGAASLEVAGGRALCGAPKSPFNKVLALGLGVAVTEADLDAIDAFYDERGVPAQIELCPLVPASLALTLNRRGYVLHGFENQLVRELGPAREAEPAGFDVTVAGAVDDALWLRLVSEGFAAGEAWDPAPPPDVVATIGAVMRQFAHPDLTRFLIGLDGAPAGAGASYVCGGVLGITGTATAANFRRRGVHTALVAHMLNAARGRADLAMATTEPGSTSQRTFERLGFQVIYTRAILVRS